MVKPAFRSLHRFLLSCFAAWLAISLSHGSSQLLGQEPVDSEPTASELLPSIDQRFAEGFGEQVPDFQKHIVPLFGRLGCNGRSCHGSFQGQGGFRLSLFGYDFTADHAAIHNAERPRVDLEQPLQSLIYSKPSSDIDHEGGQRFEPGSWQAHVLEQWLQAGAPTTDPIQQLVELKVEPSEIAFRAAGEQAVLKVVAVWEDGTQEDVTVLSRFRTNDEQIALIDEAGVVTAQEPGDTHVVVFYDKAVVPIPVLRPVSELIGENYPAVEAKTHVDELVIEKLKKLGIVPSPVADDSTFLRRICLDLTGTLPTPEEIRTFCADTDPDKRAKKIDELLESPAYAAWWTTLLCDVTGNNSEQLNNTLPFREQASKDWYEWIYRRVDENMPYDELVEGIVTARSMADGQSYTQFAEQMCEIYRDEKELGYAQLPGLTHYWSRQGFRESEERAIHFAYAFMGIRIQCAQCHKHPFDQWSKADFDAFAKFFDQVAFDNSGRTASPEEFQAIIDQLGVTEQRGNQLRQQLPKFLEEGKTIPFPVVSVREPRAANPRQRRAQQNQGANQERKYNLLGLAEIELAAREDVRVPLMDWLRDSRNPYFAKAYVNRVWSVYFGRGIVHPTDDLSLANPPSNAPLLDYLASGFIASGFDMKWVHREIANSQAYQRDWRTDPTNASDHRNFSHSVPRRMPAEVVMDALHQATASEEVNAQYRSTRDGHSTTLAGTRFNGRTADLGYALQVFGRSTRETTCDCDRAADPSLLQTVFLYNDREVHEMLRRPDGWLGLIAGSEQQHERQDEARRQQERLAQERSRSRATSIETLTSQRQQFERRLEQARVDNDVNLIARMQRRLDQVQRQIAQLQSRESEEQMADSTESTPAAPEPAAPPLDIDALIETAYLRTLSRLPSDAEMQRCREHFATTETTTQGLEGLVWVLVNTKEFLVNH